MSTRQPLAAINISIVSHKAEYIAATVLYSLFTTLCSPSRYSYVTPVKHPFDQLSKLLQHHDPRILGGIAAGVVVAGATTYLIIRSRRPSATELERRRREHITTIGRITDGYLVDARTLDGEDSISPTPEVLFYSYRLAGVTYNCAQDVSLLPGRVLGYRIDQPIQIRYDTRNPGNSILVSETWSGLWQTQTTHTSKHL
jgi:hypothetical protein